MRLSEELLSAFVDATKSEKQTKDEATVYGTIVIQNGSRYVQLDGSDLLTPISTTADAINGERVTVMIKNHTAVVTGNLKSPAARVADVQILGTGMEEVVGVTTELALILEGKVDDAELAEQVLRIDELFTNKEETKVVIEELKKFDTETTEKLTALTAESGVSGIWSYKTLPSGEIELWGTHILEELECATEFDGWYRTEPIEAEAFPFEVHNANLVASYESDGYGGMLWATNATTTTNPPSYYLIRPTSATITSGKINFHVIGKLTV